MKPTFLAAALFLASSAHAFDAYIGFTFVQSSGNVKYVNSMISSNDTQSRMIFTTLTVKAADGTAVCNVSVEKHMVTHPAIYPLQFRITYPTKSIDSPILRGTRRYTIYGRFTIEGNPEQTSIANDKNEWTFEFPSGGTPACISLLN